jgi:Arc/MetJ-type ribon-helix-helix transcriptional regulator
MKRMTVSLPDDLAEQVRHAAGKGNVSAYIAAALREYGPGESLDDILADWERETPVPEEIRRQVRAEMIAAGFDRPAESDDRLAG